MIARTDSFVNAEARYLNPSSFANGLLLQRLLAALAVQHAFGRRNDDLWAFFFGGQSLSEDIAHVAHVIGVVDLANPLNSYALNGFGDWILGGFGCIVRTGRHDILTASCSRIVVIDHYSHTVRAVEDHVANRGGQAIVPESTVPDDREWAPLPSPVEGSIRCRAEAITHRRAANFERRQRCKEVAADVGGDLVLAQFLFHELQGSKDRAFRTACAETGRPDRNRLGEIRDFRTFSVRRANLTRKQLRCHRLEKCCDAVKHHLPGVFAGHRENVLAVEFRRSARTQKDRGEPLLNEFRLAFLDDQHRFLLFAELEKFISDNRVRHVHYVKRYVRITIDVGEPKSLQGPYHTIVHAPLQHDPNLAVCWSKAFIQAIFTDVFLGRRPSVLHLVLFVSVRHGWQHHAREIAAGRR